MKHAYARRSGWWVMAFALGACAGPAEEAGSADVQQETFALDGSLQKLVHGYPPGGSPGSMVLLSDGRVLASGPETSNSWYTLTPDLNGSYVNGHWDQVASSHLGHLFGPSFVLRDGRYFICGGEYVSDDTERKLHASDQDRARCELFDPVQNSWFTVADMPQTVADSPAAELSDGTVLNLSHASQNSYLFNSSTNTWTQKASYPSQTVNTEGSCVLLGDASVFCGMRRFVRYSPASDLWSLTASTPGSEFDQFSSTTHDEIGPLLLLPSGNVFVLGGNANNGFFDPAHNQWFSAASTPAPYNHGDAPSAVEVNGDVLSVVTTDAEGEGQPNDDDPSGPNGKVALYEYQVAKDTWSNVPLPSGVSLGSGNRERLLNLPRPGSTTAQILVSTGMSDGTMLVYNSGATPTTEKPTLQKIAGPVNGVFTLTGTELNGLTNGSDLGDDTKSSTNYPIVSLTSNSTGQIFFARSFAFSQMAPTRGTTPETCSFTLPDGLPNATYQVRVSANGVPSSNSLPLVVSETHIQSVTGPLTGTPGTNVTWQVNLSNAAPAGGTLVTLASSAAGVATVPSGIRVAAGSSAASVTVAVKGIGVANITASVAGSFRPLLRTFGWNINDLSGPNILYDGTSPSWTLTLSQQAPPGGASVNVFIDSNVAIVPSTVTVPAGAKSTTFTVSQGPGEGVTLVHATAIATGFSHAIAAPIQLPIGDTMTFFKCSDEFSTCAIGGGPRYMAFGIDDKFNFASTSGTVACDTSTFGDPDTGAFKACYYSAYTLLGSESSTLSVPTRTNVAYGVGSKFNYKDITGSFTCDNATFGDPAVGAGKACYAGPADYEFVTTEGGSFTVNANTPIAYGGSGRFTFKVKSGTVNCDNTTFGDPAVGAGKACYRFNAPFRANEGQAFSTSGLTFTYYGSGANDDFLRSSAISGTCSNDFFGGDPDVTHTKHCYGL